jgi:alkanesulfonate monooxygenase SsuD/methylene tetrahydromethanopterin reductase-like flavin-dependent oxidoreductase (luciferase family)
MDYGAHLPLIDFDGSGYSLDGLLTYADTARECGYAALTVNDHMLFSRPWLDGPTALAAVASRAGDMTLMTSLILPAIRGPIPTAKTVVALDILSHGRLIVGVGPGSSRADYEAIGLDFETRWKRIDDAVKTLRALWRGEAHRGAFYSSEGIRLEPPPVQAGGPPIWIGSWGSDAGLRRTARLADGWLASAYNTTPADFRIGWEKLKQQLPAAGKDPSSYPNALATMWTYVTEDKATEERMINDAVAKMLNRDPAELAPKLLIGPAEKCAAILRAYQDAGLQRVLLWPVADPVEQLRVFKERVQPLVEA